MGGNLSFWEPTTDCIKYISLQANTIVKSKVKHRRLNYAHGRCPDVFIVDFGHAIAHKFEKRWIGTEFHQQKRTFLLTF